MMDPQRTESIKSLINDIDKGNIVLPEFQRDFVWDIGKTYDLFDSLVRDIFIGAIIYGKPSFEITVREIDKRPRKGIGSRAKLKIKSYSKEEIKSETQINNFRLVLDGQQRITSLYRALKGIDEVWLIIRNDEELDDDVQSTDFKDRSLEELIYEFRGQEDDERLSINIFHAYKIAIDNLFEDDIRKTYFDNLTFTAGMDDDELISNFRRYLIVCKKIDSLLSSEKLLSYYLLNMNTDKFSLFFERSNSKGIQLNFIDILAAKLYKGFNLREKVEELQVTFADTGYVFNREIIVRAIAYIVSNGKEVNRSYILGSLNYVHFVEYWNEVCDYYKKALDFLYKGNFILSQSWMPYENMIIPLIIFLRELKSNDFSQMNEKQLDFIKYWYWASILSQRYSSGSNEVIIQDSIALSNIARNKKISDRSYFTRLKIQMMADDILTFNKKGSVVYKGILNMINFDAGGLIDWPNSNKLTIYDKIEDHHIFPVEYLKTSFKDDENAISLIDSVANRTLIPKITNIKIGKKAPSIYLKELKLNNPALDKSLKYHLIPEDILSGLYDDFYTDFLEVRANLIMDLIDKYVMSKEKLIFDDFYKQPIIKNTGTIKIHANYYRNKVEATFNIDTQNIFYAGKNYSVSLAADKAKEDLSGKTNTSTNGWKFWKYIDDDGNFRFIDDFRKI